MLWTHHRLAAWKHSRHHRLSYILLACTLAACGSSTGGSDGGSTSPSSAVQVSVTPSNQAQSVQIPQGSGPVTGTIDLPPITAPTSGSASITLSVESGSNVAFAEAGAGAPSARGVRTSDTTLPGGPYIFELTLTAIFPFTLSSVPSFTLNLGSLGSAAPNGAYAIVVELDGDAPSIFPITAVNDSISFPGVNEPVMVPANSVLRVGIALASNVSGQPDAGPSSDAGAAAVFVVDSTSTLYSFDGSGTLRGKVKLGATVGNLNGGEIALDSTNVYVTLGSPANDVAVYSQNTLAPVAISFTGMNVPRGIAFDSHNDQLYVGNGGSTVTVYKQNGSGVSETGGFPSTYGPSGVAYDETDHTIWVASYGPSIYGTAEFNEDGSSAQAINLTTQFVSPNPHTQSYSIAYCPGACLPGNVLVGFIDDGSGMGTAVVAGYTKAGALVGSSTGFTKPYQLTFDASTYLWVADESGLFKIGAGAGNVVPSGFTTTLTPPIYGVGAL